MGGGALTAKAGPPTKGPLGGPRLQGRAGPSRPGRLQRGPGGQARQGSARTIRAGPPAEGPWWDGLSLNLTRNICRKIVLQIHICIHTWGTPHFIGTPLEIVVHDTGPYV